MVRSRILGVWLVLAACDRGESTAPALHASRAAPVKVARDFDGDGVADADDRCPGAAGLLADGCPDPDSDGDGFLDSVDRCVGESGVEPDGCPIRDVDADGILDPDDRCRAEAEARNGFEDEDGCPDQIPEDLAFMLGPVHGIKFDLDKDTIKPASRPLLDRIVAALQKYTDVRVEIVAHRDSTDNYGRVDITMRRAKAVLLYLVAHGVDERRLESYGAGPDEPLDTNKTAAGRAKNRRVEFKILVRQRVDADERSPGGGDRRIELKSVAR